MASSELQVVVVTGDYYRGEEAIDYLTEEGSIAVTGIYRTYHFETLLDQDPPGLIIGDGSCKDRDEQGVSFRVHYDAQAKAEEYGIPYLSYLSLPELKAAVQQYRAKSHFA